jgi:hypothetical protein
MLFLLPCIYLFSFLQALYRLLKRQPQYMLVFFVIGLPIYFTSLSLTYQYGFESLVPVFQSFKEIIVLITLCWLIFVKKRVIVLRFPDKLMIAYLIYTFLYVLLPLGNFGFVDKLLALKGLSFFPLIYFTGRYMIPEMVNLKHIFHYICLVAVLAAIVLGWEVWQYQHLQTLTGYAEYNERFFGAEPSGNFGLSWTFETSNGLKRFASFYGGPLELGANMILTLAACLSVITTDDHRIKMNRIIFITLITCTLSIFFAISRASLVSYFAIMYLYAFITGKKQWLKIFHYAVLAAAIAIAFYIKGDIYELIITTINFTDNSSAFHVLQWLEGLNAISSSPLGLGLGMSGRVSATTGDNIGGENQLIIIGVQTGVITMLLYLTIYIWIIQYCIRIFKTTRGKTKRLALCILLIKTGLIIPTLTANVEAYVYISYFTWFCTGLLIAMEDVSKTKNNILSNAAA